MTGAFPVFRRRLYPRENIALDPHNRILTTAGGSIITLPSNSLYRGDDFALRIAELFPNGWAAPEAKSQSGGILHTLFGAWGGQLEFVFDQLTYAYNAIYLQTATDPELDLGSKDYLGDFLPRPPGMDDETYAALIRDSIFRPAATRQALSDALYRLTGYRPRMFDPWCPGDTGAWDTVSFWGIDTVDNPGVMATPDSIYQGFIRSAPMAVPAQGGNPVLTYDDGAFWDVAGYSFRTIVLPSYNLIFSTLRRLHAYGTIVWVKIVPPDKLNVVPVINILTDPDGVILTGPDGDILTGP